MIASEELRALADLLHNRIATTALPQERQQELLLKGIVALLEEGAGDRVEVVDLLRETAASSLILESVRSQALQVLLRLARGGSSDSVRGQAVDALYRLAVESDRLGARQAIIAENWQPETPALRALFDWFTQLETSAPYPEASLPLLTQGYWQEASPELQRRLLATAGPNRAENWARIISAVQERSESGLADLAERYPQLTPTERAILLSELAQMANRESGAVQAREALAQIFIQHEDQQARQLILEQSALPEDPEQRALFLFLSGAWPEYEALDFDHHLLTSAYENAGRSLRRRLLEHSRHTGQVDWLRNLGSASGEVRWLNDLTDADWELSIRRLVENDRSDELWRLAQVAPPIWSAAMLARLARSSWQPNSADEQAGFTHLARLAGESLGSPLTVRPKKGLPRLLTPVHCLSIHPSGRLLAAGSSDQIITLWNLPDGDFQEPPVIGPTPVTRALAFSPDGEMLACANGDNRIRVFRLHGRQLVKVFEGHRAMIRALAVHPDGRTLYSAGFDGSIRFWRFPHGAELKTLRPGPGEIFSLVLSANGKHLISAGADSIVRVWTLPEGTAARELLGHTDTVTHLAASPTSELVASAGRDGTIRIWNFTSGGLVRVLPNPNDPITALCINANDRVLVGGHNNGDLTLWSLSTGRVIDRLTGHRQPITGLVLSPGEEGPGAGDTLYSADSGGQVQVWDLSTFLTIRLPGETARPGAAAEMQERLKNPNLSPAEKKWLSFSAELARWRQRYDIELAEFQAIPIGEFDIEL